MPHIHTDYSANLEDAVDIGALCEAIRAAAARIEAFPMAGIRARATRVDHVAMADGDGRHVFIDLRSGCAKTGQKTSKAMQSRRFLTP